MLTSTWSAEYRWEQGQGQLGQKGGTGPCPVPSREEVYSGAAGYNMDTPALGSAGLLLLVKSGLWCQLPGLGSSFSPGLGCFHTLSLFLPVLRAVAPPSLGGKAAQVPTHITSWPHGLVTPNIKGQTDIAPVLAQIEALSLRRQLQLPQAGPSSEEGCLCK